MLSGAKQYDPERSPAGALGRQIQEKDMKKYKDVVLSKKDWMTMTLLQAFDSNFKPQAASRKRQASRRKLDKSK